MDKADQQVKGKLVFGWNFLLNLYVLPSHRGCLHGGTSAAFLTAAHCITWSAVAALHSAYINLCPVSSWGMPLHRVTQPLMQVDERGLCLPSLAAGPWQPSRRIAPFKDCFRKHSTLSRSCSEMYPPHAWNESELVWRMSIDIQSKHSFVWVVLQSTVSRC